METKQMIADGKTALGIEFGSTRIKVVLIDKDHHPIASGSHDWENRLENNIWTYTLEDIWSGLQDSYQNLVNDVKEKYDITLTKVGSIGFSAMMHGYMAFDKDGELLVPFRTWRNTMTEEASEKLTEAFSYHIPQRWSIAHLYQAILKEEEHVKDIDYLTTLAGYVHWKLTGEKVLGVGEASGMFPIDIETKDYNQTMIKTFDNLIKDKKFGWKLENILPKVLIAGDKAGILSEEGAKLLDPSGNLEAGIPLCPPEGDAGTGMVATNSVTRKTSKSCWWVRRMFFMAYASLVAIWPVSTRSILAPRSSRPPTRSMALGVRARTVYSTSTSLGSLSSSSSTSLNCGT